MGEREERTDESKKVQTTPTRTYCKRNRPLPYCNQNCRTPRHWKFTQHHRTTRPPPPTVGSTSAYPLRNSTNLHTVRAKSQLYFNSFLPSVLRDWNELPEVICSSASLSVFKNKLNRDSKMPSKFYFIGKWLGQIYHARLGTNRSSLNQHLFS